MPSDEPTNPSGVELSVKPEPEPPNVRPVAAFASATNIRIGGPQSTLLVPPEHLPPLTSDQVTMVLQVADSQSKQTHELAMKQLEMKGKDDVSTRGLASMGLLLIFGFVGVALYKGEFVMAREILTHVAVGVSAYIAGRGRERLKLSQ